MEKQSEISQWLGKLHRNFGSLSGNAAPAPFRRIGGPVTGSLVQGAMLAAPMYLGRRALGWLRYEDPEESKANARRLALMGLLGGVAVNSPRLLENAMDMGAPGGQRKDLNWNVGRLDGIEKPQSLRKRAGYWDPWQFVSDRQRDHIPVGYTRREILDDPYMSLYEKSRMLAALDGTQKRGLISWSDVSKGAVGAGAGYVAGDLLGRAVSVLFGKISPATQRVFSGAGAVAGILRNTGALR